MSRVRRIPCKSPSRSCARRRSPWLCADTCPMAGTRTGPVKSFSELFVCSFHLGSNAFPSNTLLEHSHAKISATPHNLSTENREQHEPRVSIKQSPWPCFCYQPRIGSVRNIHRSTSTQHASDSMPSASFRDMHTPNFLPALRRQAILSSITFAFELGQKYIQIEETFWKASDLGPIQIRINQKKTYASNLSIISLDLLRLCSDMAASGL
jgi:hypothetical protein